MDPINGEIRVATDLSSLFNLTDSLLDMSMTPGRHVLSVSLTCEARDGGDMPRMSYGTVMLDISDTHATVCHNAARITGAPPPLKAPWEVGWIVGGVVGGTVLLLIALCAAVARHTERQRTEDKTETGQLHARMMTLSIVLYLL